MYESNKASQPNRALRSASGWQVLLDYISYFISAVIRKFELLLPEENPKLFSIIARVVLFVEIIKEQSDCRPHSCLPGKWVKAWVIK